MSLHFIRPEWLLALVPLALLLAWLWKTKDQRSAWQSYIAPHLTRILLTPGGKQRSHRLTLLTMISLIGTLALAGPAVNKQTLPVFSSAQGRVIVLDMSNSLYATDLAPNRLTQEKFRATDLINGLKDGETALVAYAGDAFTISPMTTDRQTLLNLLPTLTPDIMPVQGSNLSSAIRLAKQLLAQSGHQQGDIVLLTDGISPTQYDDSLSQLKGSNYRLAVLAMGTAQGAPIRLPDGQLQRYNASDVVVAKTDFGLLGRLATATDGIMVPFNPDGSGVQALLTWLDKITDQAKDTGIKGEQWQDLGPYLALLLLLPVLYSFRSGILACIGLLVISQPQPAHAANWWQDLWQTPNQQGQSAFNSQAYQSAANLFEDSNWRGSAHYRAGDYEKALAEFQRDESAIGQFNQGNARMQMGQLDEAIANYEAALIQNPDFADAKANLALAKQLKKQQEQQQNQQNKQNQQGQQNQQDKQNQQGQQNQQDKQNQQGQQNQQDKQNQQGQQNQQDKQNQQGLQNQQDKQNQQGQQNQQGNKQPNEASMQADVSPSTQSEDQGKQADAKAAAQLNQEMGEQPSSGSIAPSELSTAPLPEEMQRALRGVTDDPQVLLRNKMLLEYQKRRMRGEQPKDTEQW